MLFVTHIFTDILFVDVTTGDVVLVSEALRQTLADSKKLHHSACEICIMYLSFCSNTDNRCGTGRRGDCEGALSLWTTIQDLDIPPSSQFLSVLAALLRSHKREVPFVVTSGEEQPEQTGPESMNNSVQTNSSSL